MLETSWLWFVISKEYVELTRPKIESRDPIFFTGTRSRSRVSGNDRLFPCGSEFGPNLEILAGPAIQLRPGPGSYNNRNPAQGVLWSWHRVATLCQDHRTPSTELRLLYSDSEDKIFYIFLLPFKDFKYVYLNISHVQSSQQTGCKMENDKTKNG